MRKRIFTFIFIFVAILIIPKNGFAAKPTYIYPENTYTFYFPSNAIAYKDFYNGLSLRDRPFIKLIYDNPNLMISNPDTNINIIRYEYLDNNTKLKFSKLSGVTDDDLIFHIPADLRNYFRNEYGVDPFANYNKIKFDVKEYATNNSLDLTIDFTKSTDYFDYSALAASMLDIFTIYGGDGLNTPFTISPDTSSNEMCSEILSLDGKRLVKIYFDDVNHPYKVFIQEGVTYKDNVTYVLDDVVKEYLANQGVYINTMSLVFGHEPQPETTLDSKADKVIKKIKNNPQTYNNVLIVLIVSICAVGGFGLVRKYKNN